MLAFGERSSCAYPASLVLIEALPLCRVVAPEWPGEEVPDSVPLLDDEVEAAAVPERPARCAAVMPCADAFALLEEVGHVGW